MSDNTATQDRTKYLDAVRQGLTQVLNKDVSTAGEDTKLFDELGLDSGSALELIINIEEILDIQLDAEELEMTHFDTVGALADFVAAEASA